MSEKRKRGETHPIIVWSRSINRLLSPLEWIVLDVCFLVFWIVNVVVANHPVISVMGLIACTFNGAAILASLHRWLLERDQ